MPPYHKKGVLFEPPVLGCLLAIPKENSKLGPYLLLSDAKELSGALKQGVYYSLIAIMCTTSSDLIG